MSETRASRLLLLVVAYLLLVFVPPLLILIGVSASEIVEVIQTGICPGSTPDGSPYPCSVGDFVAQILFGPFTLVLTIGMVLSWGLAISMALGIYFFMKRLLTTPEDQHSRIGPTA